MCSCETSPLCLPQRPTRPMPIPTSKTKHVPDACLRTGSPGRKHEVPSSAPPIRKAVGSARSRSGLHGGQGVPVTVTPQPGGTRLVQDATHRVQLTHNKPRSFCSTSGLGHTLKPQAQAKFSAGNAPSIPRPAAKSMCQDPNLNIKAAGKEAPPTSIHLCQEARKKPRLSPCLSPLKSSQRADPQPQQQGPRSETLQLSKESQDPATPPSPIKMVFKRSKGGQWSCSLVPSPSLPPAEKPTPCFSEPSHLGEERGTRSQGPFSVQHTHNKPWSFSSTSGLGHTLKPQAEAKISAGNAPSIPRPAAKRMCQDPNLNSKAAGKRAAPTSIHLCQKARKKPRLSPCLSPSKSLQRADPQPQQQGPKSKTLQLSKAPQDPVTPPGPIPMAFK